MTIGMMTSLSLPGLPSAFNLRISPEFCAAACDGNAADAKPKADITDANRRPNALRVTDKFISPLLQKDFSAPKSRQREAVYVAPCRNRDVLFSFHRIRHRRRADDLSGVEMPKRLSALRIDGLKGSGIVPEENHIPGAGHCSARRVPSACLRIFPRHRAGIQIVRKQNLLRGFIRNALHAGRV